MIERTLACIVAENQKKAVRMARDIAQLEKEGWQMPSKPEPARVSPSANVALSLAYLERDLRAMNETSMDLGDDDLDDDTVDGSPAPETRPVPAPFPAPETGRSMPSPATLAVMRVLRRSR